MSQELSNRICFRSESHGWQLITELPVTIYSHQHPSSRALLAILEFWIKGGGGGGGGGGDLWVVGKFSGSRGDSLCQTMKFSRGVQTLRTLWTIGADIYANILKLVSD